MINCIQKIREYQQGTTYQFSARRRLWRLVSESLDFTSLTSEQLNELEIALKKGQKLPVSMIPLVSHEAQLINHVCANSFSYLNASMNLDFMSYEDIEGFIDEGFIKFTPGTLTKFYGKRVKILNGNPPMMVFSTHSRR